MFSKLPLYLPSQNYTCEFEADVLFTLAHRYEEGRRNLLGIMSSFHVVSFRILQTNYWKPNIIKNVLMRVFICSFCPLENILLMLPTHSESVLWQEDLSKWQTLHDLWHWKWVWFCFWIVCYQRTKILWAACS